MLPLLLAAALASAPAPHQLAWDPRVDLPVTGALLTGWLLSEAAFKHQLAPDACRWCATNDFDTAVRRAFNPSLTPSDDGVKAPDTWSNVVGFGALPVGLLGVGALLSWRDGAFLEAFPVDVLLIAEAALTAQVVNQAVKFAVGRARPYTVGVSAEQLAAARDPADHHLSFFSGHATFTFAIATSAATVFSLRGYRHAWVAWAVGLPLATATAVLRLGADKHWASDVLLGAAFGSAVGVLLPRLAHARLGPVEARLAPLPNGLAVAGRF